MKVAYMGAYTYDAGLNPFLCSRSYMDVHHSDAFCLSDDVVVEALDGPDKSLEMLLVRAACEQQPCKFDYRMK